MGGRGVFASAFAQLESTRFNPHHRGRQASSAMRFTTILLALLLQHSVFAARPAKRHYNTHDYYVLEHDPSGDASLDECAGALGVELVEQAGELQNHYLVRTTKPLLSERDSEDRVLRVYEDLQRRAQVSSHARADDVALSRRVASSLKYLSRQELRQRVKRAPPPIRPLINDDAPTAQEVAEKMLIVDPEFTNQWHLVNDEYPSHMMNVTDLWEEGITGKGVISTLVDDGLDYNSDDLAANFYAPASHDYNDHEDLPTPKLFDDHHGTRCAGQIAAVKNNVCGIGIAYDSKVAAVRILSGPISDIDEAAALNFGYQDAAIYSCSWGPPDDGKAMEGPGYLIKQAMVNGIQNGRGGLGSIFVFASGNGGRNGDQCNFDGYTNSIFSITVASVDYKGLHPDYSEACAANMIVAYSSGSGNHIITTDVGKNKCARGHGGTSAAAPNAAGVFALALQVRPDLNWRDFQHLCIRTAVHVNPDDPDWEMTAAGRPYSYKYGYGGINGIDFVHAAKDWQSVKPQGWIDLPTIQVNNGSMNLFHNASGGEDITDDGVSSTMTVTKETLELHNFEKLEHITVKVWITHTRRGDVEVELISPHGVRSVLGARRTRDSATTGYPGWQFSTVKHWDEDPVGDWTIRVSDQGNEDHEGTFLGWTMTLWGSVIDPQKAQKYVVPKVEGTLPPSATSENNTSTTASPSAASTKTITKPTAHLPSDHVEAPGETHKPAFPGSNSTNTKPAEDEAAAPSTTSSHPTADEGWFSDMSNLVTNQVWFFVALGAVIVFGAAAGLFFWRRSVRRRQNYSSLPDGDEMSMRAIGGRASTRSKELYAAFDEEDDEEADEETGLRRAQDSSPVGLGYHSGFLDDDDPASAGGPATRYKDEPSPAEHAAERPPSREEGSGDSGSWEHASQDNAPHS
ncbi:peptidase S8/S53 domain-containing protein [Cytidiella melzeri]|nr:peptidase S8/S53 domain-containing protein [Cytidiella melzeri]